VAPGTISALAPGRIAVHHARVGHSESGHRHGASFSPEAASYFGELSWRFPR
jgi:hypothetical protein